MLWEICGLIAKLVHHTFGARNIKNCKASLAVVPRRLHWFAAIEGRTKHMLRRRARGFPFSPARPSLRRQPLDREIAAHLPRTVRHFFGDRRRAESGTPPESAAPTPLASASAPQISRIVDIRRAVQRDHRITALLQSQPLQHGGLRGSCAALHQRVDHDVAHQEDLYKGEFMLGDKRYCYPLTVTDHACA